MAQEHRPNCTTCGLPLSEPTCRACGGSSAPMALADGIASATSAFAPDPGRPELDLAFDAWKGGDYGRLVSHCLAAESIGDATMQQASEGPVFKATVRGLAIFIRVLAPSSEIVVEIPVVRLPLTQYVPSLRILLELSDRDSAPTRFSVRGDLVMARFVGRLASMSPMALIAAVHAVASAASDCARLLVGAMQAREISPDEHRSIAIDTLPRGLILSDELPTSSGQTPKKPGGGMFDALEPLAGPQRAAQKPAEVPPVLMPPGGVTAPAAPPQRPKVPTPARIGRPTPGHIVGNVPPAQGATVAKAGGSKAPPPTAAIPPTAPVPHAPPPASPSAPRGLVPPPKPGLSAPPPIGRTMVSADGAAVTEPSAQPSPTPTPAPPTDPLGDTFISDGQPGGGPVKTGSPADGLLELLHKAQTLGAVLSFADQPATMCLLIRATVYRSIQEHEAQANRAVASLYHATLAMTKEIYITAPGKRRGSMAIPAASPAFEAMAKIVAQRGEVDAAEPLQVQPITTAQEAKQHLARYVSEIDQAPSDTDLRHFLALGALCELLVRTKLPGATQERLRGILTHAKKEGPKQQVVDLMMTALTRMIA